MLFQFISSLWCFPPELMILFFVFLHLGLTMQANMYYKMLISWTSQKVKETYSTHNAFDFKHGTSTFLSAIERQY